MSVAFRDDWLTVHHGDVRAVLSAMEAESVDAVVTSPPYWRQRSYLADDDPLKPLELGSEPTFVEWVANLVGICDQLRRVLKPAGSLWLVLGDRFVAHGGQSPNTEKRRRGAEGWILRDRVVWAKTNGLPESVGDRLHVRDEVIFRFTLREKAYFDVDAIREKYAVASLVRHAAGRAATFAGKKSAAPGQPARTRKIWTGRQGDEHRAEWHRQGRVRPDGKNPGNVWPEATAAGQRGDFAHFAMFPGRLVRRPILATVPPGGVVLDPFAETGTVAEVANAHLRRAVLIELDPAAIEMIRRRCEARPMVAVPA